MQRTPSPALPPSSYARVAAWSSRDRWLAAVDAALLTLDADAARRKLVSREAVRALARHIAASADAGTGRDAMPGNDALVAASGYTRRTVQMAVDALEALGLLVKLREGKDRLARSERLELWARGSRARAFRAVYACTLPASAVIRYLPRSPAVRRPTARRGPAARGKADLAPLGAPMKGRRRSPGYGPRVDDLALGLIERVPALRRTGLGRVRPALTRFARAGWEPRDLVAEIDALHRRLGWTAQRSPDMPAVWLAGVLRRIDHRDNPALLRAAESWSRARQGELDAAPRCPHGVNGGSQANGSGAIRCPLCRRR